MDTDLAICVVYYSARTGCRSCMPGVSRPHARQPLDKKGTSAWPRPLPTLPLPLPCRSPRAGQRSTSWTKTLSPARRCEHSSRARATRSTTRQAAQLLRYGFWMPVLLRSSCSWGSGAPAGGEKRSTRPSSPAAAIRLHTSISSCGRPRPRLPLQRRHVCLPAMTPVSSASPLISLPCLWSLQWPANISLPAGRYCHQTDALPRL